MFTLPVKPIVGSNSIHPVPGIKASTHECALSFVMRYSRSPSDIGPAVPGAKPLPNELGSLLNVKVPPLTWRNYHNTLLLYRTKLIDIILIFSRNGGLRFIVLKTICSKITFYSLNLFINGIFLLRYFRR